MKRIVASIGVAALGAACVQTSNAQGDGDKPWTASVALRGFYDDNIGTSKDNKVDSWGAEISPTLAFYLRGDQTTAQLVYTYGYKYYDTKPPGNVDHDDQTHTIAASLLHAFNERTTISVSDSFVIGQEPDVLRAGADYASFQRISGDNIRNFGSFTLNHQFLPKFGIEAGYVNSLFNYADSGPTYGVSGGSLTVTPSNSGLLDRMEQTAHLDARWTIQPTTIGLVGYAFSYAHYTGDEVIGIAIPPIMSDARDARSHYLYAGAEHTFQPGLNGSLRAGARFTDYFNSPANESGVSPYVLASLNYDYSKDSSFQIGVSHDLSATDAFYGESSNGSITTSSENTVAYLSWSHRIVPSLTFTAMGQFQYSTFQGGIYSGESDQYYLASASLTYQINRHIAATASYHYDLLDSDIPGRGFDRNRVFLGATFTY